MIGKFTDVTNFNRQQAIKFIAIKCTECDIYGSVLEKIRKYVGIKHIIF